MTAAVFDQPLNTPSDKLEERKDYYPSLKIHRYIIHVVIKRGGPLHGIKRVCPRYVVPRLAYNTKEQCWYSY